MRRGPEFARCLAALEDGRFEEALAVVDGMLAIAPHETSLQWERARCLEELERWDEMKAALEALLADHPDFAAAIIKQVQYATLDAEDDDEDDERLSEAEQARRDHARTERARQASLVAEKELRRALQLELDHVDGLHLLSGVLRQREDADAALLAEADTLLNRAIALAPLRVDLLESRASARRHEALIVDEQDTADSIETFSGLRYRKSTLEAALADYQHCFALTGDFQYAVRMASLLHDLGRFDEALESYDRALERMPEDDPARVFIIETRARSENQGAGEREQMAKLFESALLGDGKDRNLQDDVAVQALLGAAQAIRSGKSVSAAINARISDDPDMLTATSVAQQILNVAFEPEPGLSAVDAADYPAYQRGYADDIARQVGPLGLHFVGDGEAKGLFPMLGQHVLIRFFADASGEVGVAAFALKPKWPGWLGFLMLLLTGNWKRHVMLECVTQFDDGAHLSTQPESVSAFEFAGPVQVEKLPRKTPAARLVARHLERVAAYKAAHPSCRAMTANDLPGMERRWIEGQRVKRAYRASIGYVTEHELRRLLGAHYERFAPKVRAQLAVLAADMQGAVRD